MALFGSFGPVISTALGTVGKFGGTLGALANIGSTAFAAAQGPRAIPAAVRAPAPQSAPLATAGSRVFTSRMGVLAAAVAPILLKIAQKLGRPSMSIRGSLRLAKRLGKFMAPAAVATALGITTTELADLILVGTQMPRRRMNPFNPKAARRAMSRIEALARGCQKIDMLRSRGRRRSSGRGGKGCSTATIVKA